MMRRIINKYKGKFTKFEKKMLDYIYRKHGKELYYDLPLEVKTGIIKDMNKIDKLEDKLIEWNGDNVELIDVIEDGYDATTTLMIIAIRRH